MNFVKKKPKTKEEIESLIKLIIWVIGFVSVLGYGIYLFLPPKEAIYEGNESIKSFLLEVRLKPEETIFNEIIQIAADRKDFRLGVQRSFPLQLATNEKVTYEVMSVSKDNTPADFKVSESEGRFRILASNKDNSELAPGNHTFSFQYSAKNIFRKNKDNDILNWPASGLYWVVPVEQAIAHIYLPASLDPQKVKLNAYTYSRTTRKFDYESVSIRHTQIENQNVIEVRNLSPLPPRVGLVFELVLPKGFVSEQSTPVAKTGDSLKISDDGVVAQSGGKVEEGKTIKIK